MWSSVLHYQPFYEDLQISGMKSTWRRRQQKYLLPRLIFVGFKIMGLAPLAAENATKVNKQNDSLRDHHRASCKFVGSRLGGIYNCCLIPSQLYLAFLSSKIEYGVQYPYRSDLTDKIELALTICGNGIVAVIWLTYLTKQKSLAIIVNRFTHIDVTLEGVNGTRVGACERQSGFRRFIILFATTTFLWIQLLSSEEFAFHAPVLSWFSFIMPSIIINWYTIQYVLTLNLIEDRFRLLNDILLRCSMTCITFPLREFFAGLVSTDDFSAPIILTLRRAHTDLYEISDGVADFYSFPILLVIGFTNIAFIYNGYYLVVLIVYKSEEMSQWVYVNTILWIVILLFPLMALVARVIGISKEMKKTADVIPDLLVRHTTDLRDKAELGKFAFELLHKNVEFTACRFFPLNGTLLQSMLGTASTYLTMMFQMQAGSLRLGDISRSATGDAMNMTPIFIDVANSLGSTHNVLKDP